MESRESLRDLSIRGQVLTLLAAAGYSPFSVWAQNSLEFPHPERLLPIVGIVWLGVWVPSRLAQWLGATRWAATGGGVIWALTLSMGGIVAGRLGVGLTLVAGLVLGVLVVTLMTRLRAIPAARFPLIGLTFVLGLGPFGLLAADFLAQSTEPDLRVPDSSVTEVLGTRPSIYLVIVDGFVGIDGSRETFGIAQPSWVSGLEERGFQVPRSGWTSYPITIASVPSLLDMDYPIDSKVDGSRAVFSSLIKRLGGANRLVSILNDNGYATVMVEAGWAWSHCGPEFDSCVASAFIDEAVFAVLRRSIIGEWVLEKWASPFTHGAKHAMSRLMVQANPDVTTESGPRFVFGHVMAPHPPMFLTSDCDVEFRIERAGPFFRSPYADLDYRTDTYFEQADCVTEFMYEFSSQIPRDDVVVFVADHGSDSRSQLQRPGSDWTRDDSIERMSTLIAVRSGSPCDLGDPVMLPNLMRTLLACISDQASSPPIKERMFTGGLKLGPLSQHFQELSQQEVAEILGISRNDG